ncbi:MAG: sulfotransferase [Gemmatimonadota bacterium]|jgi:hypothetical protein|nr:sulfotransferase [Gemmatimonadota bacterium]MDP7031052.1 sulfotransferase [Gemmatimonadota bacterium]
MRRAGRTLREMRTIVGSFAMARRFRESDTRVLLILGTVRSGSTVLGHILNSNPEVSGYGETLTSYRSVPRLAGLMSNVRRELGTEAAGVPWLYDKMLHDWLLLGDDVLRSERVSFLILLRDPEETLSSMHRLQEHVPGARLSRMERAVPYLRDRLDTLVEMAARVGDPGRALFVTYGQLVEQTEDVFRAIETHLDLSTPLTEEYELTPATGRALIGDPSPVIRTGRLDRTRTGVRVPADVPERELEEWKCRFKRGVEDLSRTCTTVG